MRLAHDLALQRLSSKHIYTWSHIHVLACPSFTFARWRARASCVFDYSKAKSVQFVVNQWRTNTVNSDYCVTRLVMSMDRSPITGTSFPQILPRNGDELTTFRDNFRSSSFQRPRKQLPPPTSAVKLDYITKTPHAVKDTYISTTRIDFPLLQSSPQLSKQTAQESNRSSLDHFSLETDRRLTNQTSTSSSEYSCKVLQFQPPRDRTGNAMQLSKTDFLGSRVKKWANAGSEYSTSFAKPSLEARHRLDQQNDAIASEGHNAMLDFSISCPVFSWSPHKQPKIIGHH